MSALDRHDEEQDRVDREASLWCVRLDEGELDPESQAAFEAWHGADPSHAETYRAMRRTFADIASLRAWGELVELPAAREAEPAGAGVRRWRRPALAAGGFAAVAAMLLAILFVPAWREGGPDRYATEVAEMRLITLADGSGVTLGARSSIEVRYSGAERRVVLTGGEAYFDVKHGDPRPFLVEAGESLVRDIGTKFDVNRSTGIVRVSVLEGTVAVSRSGPARTEQLLRAGQRAEVAPLHAQSGVVKGAGSGSALPIVALPAQAPAAWREGRLAYDDVRLADLVADVNRYYAPGVTLAPGAAGELRVTASFKVSEIPGFMRALSASLPVEARARSDGRFDISETR